MFQVSKRSASFDESGRAAKLARVSSDHTPCCSPPNRYMRSYSSYEEGLSPAPVPAAPSTPQSMFHPGMQQQPQPFGSPPTPQHPNNPAFTTPPRQGHVEPLSHRHQADSYNICYACHNPAEMTVACDFCNNDLCEICTRQCDRCHGVFCTFCSTINYDMRIDRTFCIDCNQEEQNELKQYPSNVCHPQLVVPV